MKNHLINLLLENGNINVSVRDYYVRNHLYILALSIFLFFLLMCACSPKQEQVEKIIEDGVEVVLNGNIPLNSENNENIMVISELFAIDTEDQATAALGLTDIGQFMSGECFDIDKNGNIFLLCMQNKDHFIYKFDNTGRFLFAFGHEGQGPGEFSQQIRLNIYTNSSGREEIIVTDESNRKFVRMDLEGNVIEERKTDSPLISVYPLSNGNYLVFKRIFDPEGKYLAVYPLSLVDSGFNILKELDSQKIPNPMAGEMLKGTYHVFSWCVSDQKIYTGFQERGYEIYVYDFDGNMIRKIKKEFTPVAISEDHKKKFMAQFENPMFDDIRKKIYFPDSMPAYHAFYCDDTGRLFVMTYERGNSSNEYIYDTFDGEGILIGRIPLSIHQDEAGVYAKIASDRLYALEEKESGYKRLAVYELKE